MCSAPAMAPRDVVTCGPDGVPCATSRTESIAVVGKAWVEQRAQDLQDGLGHEPVKDRRDTEHPRPTAGLGPSHLAHRRWNVGRVTQAEFQELVVASGLKVLEAMLEEDRAAVCGPRYAHQPARQASRTGHTPSQVVLGRWCADAGRPTRFKPSSPSPTDAVRDGSAKLGHPVQNVTREHGLTPLPR